ncbi:BTAD domain-containing putative transcriptional regulator [Nonomuraea sp. NPDC049504]|uniref:ATP-binding protein n=1 Tax=Nonomuraea sp. NPDC049504 TaxID=3154729 RepID=UPI003426E5D5
MELQHDDTFDLAEFLALTEQGREQTAVGHHAEAVTSLQKALALWGDPPLADVPDDPPQVATWRRELLWKRKVAQEQVLELRLLLGEDHQLLGDLRKEIAEDPLSETLNALLMKALYRAGYRIDALHQYDSLAALLAQDTGAEPGLNLRRLRDEIASDDLLGTSGPRPLTSAVTADDRPCTPVALGPGGLPPAQLPPAVTDFTGREDEVRQLKRYLSSARDSDGVPIASICGPPGVGKSALAHLVAHLLRPVFPDGQIYVHMGVTSERPREIGDVLAEVLSALGVPPTGLPAGVSGRTALYRSLMAGRRVLVVLDDVIGIQQIQALLPGTSGCAVLVTSRSHLVASTAMRVVRLNPLSKEESVSLLSDIVGADRVEAEPTAAADICAVCGGFPLAVRIAGSLLAGQPAWPLRTFAERLRTRSLSLLRGDDLGVEASIRGSDEALPGDARRVFRLVSMLGHGFAGWEVAMLDNKKVADLEGALELLTRHSLLTSVGVDASGQLRYGQHELLRSYGAARLSERPDEQDSAMHRLLLGWLELADLAAAQIAREPYHPPVRRLDITMYAATTVREMIAADVDGWLATEVGNLLNVIRIACERGKYQQALGIALRVAPYLYRESRHQEAEDMWRRILQAITPDYPRLQAEARHRLASLIMGRPRGPQRALPLLDEVLAAREKHKDYQGLARTLGLRAECRRREALDQQSATLLREAEVDAQRGLSIACGEARDQYTELACLRALALIASARNEHGRALGLAQDMVRVAQKVAPNAVHATYHAWALQARGAMMIAVGRPEQALGDLDQAHDLSRQARHRAGQARASELAGDALAALDRDQEAVQRYAQAAAAFDEVGLADEADRCRRKNGDARAEPG